MKIICPLRSALFWLRFWTTVVPDEDDPISRDRSISPSDRATSPGPHDDPHLHAPPAEPGPAPSLSRRARAVAPVRPISISDIVRDVAGPGPMRIIRDFDRVYMPDGCVAVNSAVVGPPGDARRSDLKRKAEQIKREAEGCSACTAILFQRHCFLEETGRIWQS